ncbi:MULTISPECIES: glycosyltransferase family 1 protein [unclassified Sulfurimonas]|uniref:glycosyltransferase family 4 protein n=1 Tax=unclassified Sulfurimonas TaxID=2623549 RepID=UPI000A5AC099|nr:MULTISPECIES: glycosyltransferase family 1 protein [unclassified Sulfurimonas]
MKPDILIDALSLLSSMTGLGRYTYEISKELKKADDFKYSYFYGYYSDKLLEISDAPNVKSLKSFIVKNSFLKKIVRRLLFFISSFSAKTYDLYWQPNFIPNEGIKAKKTVTSVHDFSFILHREFHPKERIEYFERYFFKNIYKSDMIITGSFYTKSEIMQRLDFKDDKVRVIYHGINHDVFKVYDDLELDIKLPKKYILSVGSIEPRKNLLGLLKAYNLLNDEIKAEYKLVLVGFKGWENREIMEIVNNNKDNIHYLGFVSDEELAKVYNLASLFVFASFYEGFGLPPLEAMACGTPVVCSNLTSMPEICLDAAIYCDAYDADDISKKIEIVLKDDTLKEELIKKGLKRAGEFTWKKSAEEHVKVFKEVMGS